MAHRVRTVITGVCLGVAVVALAGCDLLEAPVAEPCECAEVSDLQTLIGDLEELVDFED